MAKKKDPLSSIKDSYDFGPNQPLIITSKSVKEDIIIFLGIIFDKVDFVTIEISNRSFKIAGDISSQEEKNG